MRIYVPERVMRSLEAQFSFRPGLEDVSPVEALAEELGFVPWAVPPSAKSPGILSLTKKPLPKQVEEPEVESVAAS